MDKKNAPRTIQRLGLFGALAGLFGSGWAAPISASQITGGNASASKATGKADAKRRQRANKRLRKNGGAQRKRQSCRVNPPVTKAHNRAVAGQLGVTRRGH